MNQDMTRENMINTLQLIITGQQSGLDLTSVCNICVDTVCEYLINKNDIRGIRRYLGEDVKEDFNLAKEIIGLVKTLTDIEQENLDSIKVIENKIGFVQPIGVIQNLIDNHHKWRQLIGYTKTPKNKLEHEERKNCNVNFNSVT